MQMTRSEVPLCWWNSPAPLAEIPDFVSSDLCPPNSLVDYRICGLMQERVITVQTPVRYTSRCDQRLKAAPHWHIGKHITKRHRGTSWSMQKVITCKHEAKGHHFEHLLNYNWHFSEPTHYTTNRLFSEPPTVYRGKRCFVSFQSQMKWVKVEA